MPADQQIRSAPTLWSYEIFFGGAELQPDAVPAERRRLEHRQTRGVDLIDQQRTPPRCEEPQNDEEAGCDGAAEQIGSHQSSSLDPRLRRARIARCSIAAADAAFRNGHAAT